ncbi:universal stress protein [Motilibacter aurantiacus]|uniref:universal stress protein n=1 Tax=Motilibacter aurantiacus TaxID=2714955 RepID=UPI0014073A5E|nr:universal stress protein [Motilibacter aurantiacus]NHC46797.1 universal stress protein [Motilibacter aurantiacus]
MSEWLQRRSEDDGLAGNGPYGPVVVVGVDGSRSSRCAALAAAGTARELGATVVAAHVPTPSPVHSFAGLMGAGFVLQEAEELQVREMEQQLAALFELEEVRWRFVVLSGPVGAALDELAAQLNAAVIVVGCPRRTLRRRLVHLLAPSVPRLLMRRHAGSLLVA